MILTVNLNAALDKTYVIADFHAGRVNRVESVRTLAGGKGNNVARAVIGLGREALVTGFGGGVNGQQIIDRLSIEGIPNDYLAISQESRICLALPESGGRTTEILEPGPVIGQDEAIAFPAKLRALAAAARVVTFSGSLPRGLDLDYYARLIGIAREAGCRTVLDTSGEALRAGLEMRPDVVKPNRAELEQLLGMPLIDQRDTIRAARKLLTAGVGLVLASMGEEGAVAVTVEGAWIGHVPPVKAVNAVGSGDAMVAAIAIGLAERLSIEDALALAVAAGAANCLTLGAGQLRAIDVEALRSQVVIEQLA